MNKRIRIFLISIFAIVFVLSGCSNNKDSKAKYERESSTTVEVDTKTISETEMSTELNTESQTEALASTASIVMVGDVLLHTPVSDSGLMKDGTYNYDHLFTNVKNDIEAADLSLVNEEVILGGRELGLSGYPAFNGAFEVGDSIVKAGFDVVLHATNHALDKGKTGILNCMNFWKNTYPEINVLGINESQEEQNTICIKEINGIKISILNYTYGTNGISLPSDMPFAVNLLDRDKIASDVQIAKENADFVIVCPHWGTEYTHTETEAQQDMAAYFAELGVDLVIGTHPHVIEPVKWVEASNGHKTLVYYSIGNFINATNDDGIGISDRMVGAMAEINIEKTSEGTTLIKDYSAVPLVTHRISGSGGITTYKLSDYSEELAALNETKNRDSNFSYEYCKNLCDEVFKDVTH